MEEWVFMDRDPSTDCSRRIEGGRNIRERQRALGEKLGECEYHSYRNKRLPLPSSNLDGRSLIVSSHFLI